MGIKYPNLIVPDNNFAVLYRRYPTYNLFAVLSNTIKARLKLAYSNSPREALQFIEENKLYFTCESAQNQVKKGGELVQWRDTHQKEY